MAKRLYVSYSSMSGFRKCPRYYYWKHIRRLEKVVLKIPFITGRIMHNGIQTLFSKPQDAEAVVKKSFKEEAQKARKQFPQMEIHDEEKLAEQAFTTVGMLRAFRTHYAKFLRVTRHIATERELHYDLNKHVTVVGKIDNILNNQDSNYIYELKNLKSLDMHRVDGIKTDPQSSLYHTINNLVATKKADKVEGIIYQIIRKPSIRQKKSESKGEYLRRLEDWYQTGDGLKFHLERLKKPFIDGAHVLNTLRNVTEHILRCKTKEDYFQDFSYCIHEWGRCQYYGLCHGDEKKEIKLLTIRPAYKVTEKEEAEEDDDE